MIDIAPHFIISVNFRDTEVIAQNQGDVIWRSVVRRGGVDWEFLLLDYLRAEYNLLVGRRTVEMIILGLASAREPGTQLVRGRDLTTQLPSVQEITCYEVSEALDEGVQSLMRDLTAIFEGRVTASDGMMSYPVPIPPELKPALGFRPVVLTGEFARLRGLDEMLQNALTVPIVSETTQN